MRIEPLRPEQVQRVLEQVSGTRIQASGAAESLAMTPPVTKGTASITTSAGITAGTASAESGAPKSVSPQIPELAKAAESSKVGARADLGRSGGDPGPSGGPATQAGVSLSQMAAPTRPAGATKEASPDGAVGGAAPTTGPPASTGVRFPGASQGAVASIPRPEPPASRPAGTLEPREGTQESTREGTAQCTLPLDARAVQALERLPVSDAGWLEGRRCLVRHLIKVKDEPALRRVLDSSLELPQGRYDPVLLAERGALELRSGGDPSFWATEAERYAHRVGGETGRRLAMRVAELQARGCRRRFEAGALGRRDVSLLEKEAEYWRRIQALGEGDATVETTTRRRLDELEKLKAVQNTVGGGG